MSGKEKKILGFLPDVVFGWSALDSNQQL